MMRFLKYFLIWMVVVMVLCFVAGYVYVRVEGKRLFEQQLSKFFGQETTIGDIRYLVPAGVRFRQLEIRNILEADDVYLHLRIPFLLEKRFIIAQLELVRPVFHLVRAEAKKIDFGGTYLREQEERFQPEKRNASRRVEGILVDFITVKDGRVEILDLSLDEPAKYEVDQISGKAMKAGYPMNDQNIKFDLKGRLLGVGTEAWLRKGIVQIQGWMNWPMRGMDTTLKFTGTSGIAVTMDLDAVENHVQAKGHIDCGDVTLETAQNAREILPSFSGMLLGVLQATQSRLGMDFSFETAMDAFQVGMVDFDGELDVSGGRNLIDFLHPAAIFKSGMPDAAKSSGEN